MGVKGIRLRDKDTVVAAATSVEGDEVVLLTAAGYGKRTPMKEFPKQKRAGMGVKAMKMVRGRGKLVAAQAVPENGEIFVISSDGVVIRTEADSISVQKRDASGVKVMSPAQGAQITSIALVPQDNGK